MTFVAAHLTKDDCLGFYLTTYIRGGHGRYAASYLGRRGIVPAHLTRRFKRIVNAWAWTARLPDGKLRELRNLMRARRRGENRLGIADLRRRVTRKAA